MIKRRKSKNVMTILLFAVGFAMCCYPIISTVIHEIKQKKVIDTYEEMVEKTQEYDIETEFDLAEEYNKSLYKMQNHLLEDSDMKILNEDHYSELLNIWGNGMMGSIEIPKINVYLPVYHGADEAVLSNNIGHMEGSSLPVGGENTRCILTGHRGMPNAKLFTRLDEMEESDLFYVHIFDWILAYQVISIDVIKPEETDALGIISGKDLVSLVTCTPYGINTHRLVVTGERVAYKQVAYDEIETKNMSFREWRYVCIPLVAVVFVVLEVIKNRKRR